MNKVVSFFKNNINKVYRYIALATIIIIGAYLFFGKHFLISNDQINIVLMAILFFVILSMFITYLVVDYYKYKNKLNIIFIVVATLLLISQCLVIFLTPDIFTISVHSVNGGLITADIKLSTVFRFQSLISFTSLLIVLYSLLFLLPKEIKPNSIFMIVVLIAFIAFVSISFIYSIIAEHDVYVSFIKNFSHLTHEDCTKSFFPHKNNWGLFLFIGIYALLYLFFIFRKKWLFIPIILFYVIMVFSFCKTTLLLTPLMLFAFLVYELVRTYQNNKKRNQIIIVVVSSVLVVLLLVLFLTPLRQMLLDKLFGDNGGSTSSRIAIWSKVFELTSEPIKILFGNGFGVLTLSLLQANNRDPYCSQNWHVFKAHNMYIQSYGDGGIFMALCFVTLIAYVLYKTIKYSKINKDYSFVILLGILALSIIWVFES